MPCTAARWRPCSVGAAEHLLEDLHPARATSSSCGRCRWRRSRSPPRLSRPGRKVRLVVGPDRHARTARSWPRPRCWASGGPRSWCRPPRPGSRRRRPGHGATRPSRGSVSTSRSTTTRSTTWASSTASCGARSIGVGPATDWIRLRGPVVDDEPISPLQRVLAAADFGNGVSRLADFDKHAVHQPRPDGAPAPAAGRGVGVPRRRVAPRGATASASPRARSGTRTVRSADRCSRCWSNARG